MEAVFAYDLVVGLAVAVVILLAADRAWIAAVDFREFLARIRSRPSLKRRIRAVGEW